MVTAPGSLALQHRKWAHPPGLPQYKREGGDIIGKSSLSTVTSTGSGPENPLEGRVSGGGANIRIRAGRGWEEATIK